MLKKNERSNLSSYSIRYVGEGLCRIDDVGVVIPPDIKKFWKDKDTSNHVCRWIPKNIPEPVVVYDVDPYGRVLACCNTRSIVAMSAIIRMFCSRCGNEVLVVAPENYRQYVATVPRFVSNIIIIFRSLRDAYRWYVENRAPVFRNVVLVSQLAYALAKKLCFYGAECIGYLP